MKLPSAITGLNDTTMVLAAAPVAGEGAHGLPDLGGHVAARSRSVPALLLHDVFRRQRAGGCRRRVCVRHARSENGVAALRRHDRLHGAPRTLFRERYTELGGNIVGKDTYAGDSIDLSDQIARLPALPTLPDMLYVSSGPDDIGRLIKQLCDAGLQLPVVGGDGYDTPLLLQVAGAAADNTESGPDEADDRRGQSAHVSVAETVLGRPGRRDRRVR